MSKNKKNNVPFLTLSLDPLDPLAGLTTAVVLYCTVVELEGNVSALKQKCFGNNPCVHKSDLLIQNQVNLSNIFTFCPIKQVRPMYDMRDLSIMNKKMFMVENSII